MQCPMIQYKNPKQLKAEYSSWDIMPAAKLDMVKKGMPIIFDAVRVFEANPKIPYKYPYSFNTPTDMQCSIIPRLPPGVTLEMVKKQYNETARKLEIAIPFPEIEKEIVTDYNKWFIIFLFILVVIETFLLLMPCKCKKSAVSLKYKPSKFPDVFNPNDSNYISESLQPTSFEEAY